MQNIFTLLLDAVFPPTTRESRAAKLSFETLSRAAHVTWHEDIACTTLFPYKNQAIRTAIHMVKYQKDARLARYFGAFLADYLLEEISEQAPFTGSAPLITAIPLGAKRQKTRGYNQVELVLRAASLPPSCEYRTDILKRVRETPSQTSLSRAARLENVKHAFATDTPEAVSGRVVYLIDDVTTTGSTLGDARRALLAAGAREVRAIALAR